MGGSNDAAFGSELASENENASDLAVCLVSGGMDSCVTVAIAAREVSEVAFLHVSYGQRTEARERRAFEELANFYGARRRLVVSLEHLAKIGGSSITDDSMAVTPPNLAFNGIPSSYVPFRNAHFLSVATSWAEVIHAESIYIGAVAEDSSGYPDCRPEFYEAFERAISVGTRPGTMIKIRTPVIAMTKSDIVKLGQKLDAPLGLTWSCYKMSEQACGECDSCALRLRAFRVAGLGDPLPYVLDSKRFAY